MLQQRKSYFYSYNTFLDTFILFKVFSSVFLSVSCKKSIKDINAIQDVEDIQTIDRVVNGVKSHCMKEKSTRVNFKLKCFGL